MADAGIQNCQEVLEINSIRNREAWATREIIRYLREHPGASVVLVFGGGHRFCDDFIRENFRPRIRTLDVDMSNLGYPSMNVPAPDHCR